MHLGSADAAMNGPTRRPLLVPVRVLLVAIALAPFVPALATHVPLLAPLGRALDAWFAVQCERDPSRMLGAGAVCARCLGIYVGLGLGAVVARPRLAWPGLELAVATAGFMLLLDVASEAFGARGPSAPLRLATGLGFGYFVGALVVLRLGDAGARTSPRSGS
jgi:uncharacterized membrane protein